MCVLLGGGTDEDWGVGAEYLLVPSRADSTVDARDEDEAAWEEARCVPHLEDEEPFATIAAARVLLGELFAGGEVAIYSSHYAGEYGLLITIPDLDMAAGLRDGRSSPDKELIYLCGESAGQWEFLFAFGSPVLPSSQDGQLHVETGPALLVSALARLHPGTSPEALAALELSGLRGELEAVTDPRGVVGHWIHGNGEDD